MDGETGAGAGRAAALGVLGGSFDPPHFGHVFAALWALETGEVSSVLVVPVSAHAFGKRQGATFEQRCAMCRLAFARVDGVGIDPREGARPGTSYMVDTLMDIRRERPGLPLRLVVGSDVLADLPKWHRGAEVAALAPPLEVPRIDLARPIAQQHGALPAISSTDVRQRIASGADASRLVPASVLDYIAHQGLYR